MCWEGEAPAEPPQFDSGADVLGGVTVHSPVEVFP